MAETWFGAHVSAPSPVPRTGVNLAELIASDPIGLLGQRVAAEFGQELPFLFKLIAPDEPLSMQVHPGEEQARRGYARTRSHAEPTYADGNHKPELLLPFTEFEVLSGLRSAHEAVRLFENLHGTLTRRVLEALRSSGGEVMAAFSLVLNEATPEEVAQVAHQCEERRAQGSSPNPHADEVVGRLQSAYPGDRGVVASLLLRARMLSPWEAMFIPAGTVHAYLSGMGAEIMANSDNVLRAGLTSKRVDVPELLKVVDPVAQPHLFSLPVPEPVALFPTPVKDFGLTMITAGREPVHLPGEGPRVVLAVDGGIRIDVERADSGGSGAMVLERGRAVFIGHRHGGVRVIGGRALQAGVA